MDAYIVRVCCVWNDFCDMYQRAVELRVHRLKSDDNSEDLSPEDAAMLMDAISLKDPMIELEIEKDPQTDYIKYQTEKVELKLKEAIRFVKKAARAGASIRWFSAADYLGDQMSPEDERSIIDGWSVTVGRVLRECGISWDGADNRESTAMSDEN